MRQGLTLLLLLAIGIAPAAAQLRVVDLGAPGALEALERENPRHYRAVQGAMIMARNEATADIAEVLRVRYNARDVSYGMNYRVSYPPKRHLAFTLDEVRYYAVVTVGTRWNFGK